MSLKKMLVMIVAIVMVFSFNILAKSQKITRVGVYPLIKVKGQIEDTAALKAVLEQYPELIREAFEKADAGYLYEPFMAQVGQGAIEDMVVPKGQQFQWMSFRVGKKVKAVKDLEWASNKSLQAFGFTVPYECKDYVLMMPKPCGNIALVEIKNTYPTCAISISPGKANIGDTITVDLSGSTCAVRYEVTVYHEGEQIDFRKLSGTELKLTPEKAGNYRVVAKALNVDGIASTNDCEAKFYINHPPVCDIKVTPIRGYTGQPYTFDASGSTDKDGQVVKAEFSVTKDGAAFDKKEVTTQPLIWKRKFKKTGIYNVSVKATDDFNADCTKVFDTPLEVQKTLYTMLELGPMVARGTYTGYGFARLGLSYLISPEKVSLLFSAGGALKFSGEAFKNHFMANALVNFHFNKFFLGAGLGYTSAVRTDNWDAGVDIVTNFGFDVYSAFNKKGSIFGEVRLPMRDELDLSDAHSFLLGFRYQF